MSKTQPKKSISQVILKNKDYGLTRRKSYAKTIVNKAPVIPKPLEYEDIDKEFFNFVDKTIDMVISNKKIPTFTLFSNQRFSEYSQTWKHVDEEGNLLMNFKTVNRENNPSKGDNQGGYWNIPTDEYSTLLVRTVMEDNGKECYEVYSMKQPFCVDLTYRVSLITNTFSNLNKFNQKLNSLFKSRQFYIRPNGYYIPLVLEDITDNSEYAVSDRKFFNQTAIIKAKAYIVEKDSFKTVKVPKTVNLFMEGDSKRKPKEVNIEEYNNNTFKNPSINLTIDLKEGQDKVKFVIDTDFKVETVETYNIRNLRVSVNDIPYFIDKGFDLKTNDVVKIVAKIVNPYEISQIKFMGYNPNVKYDNDVFPSSEEIIVD